MKKPIIFATAVGLLTMGANAHADHHATTAALGAGAAHLVAGQDATAEADETFVLRSDPSGAPMCFDLAGVKAPLSACEGQVEESATPLEHIVAFDPSGAPMCFDLAGSKAPLSACEPTLEAALSALVPRLAAR